jgi:hypothetical protein
MIPQDKTLADYIKRTMGNLQEKTATEQEENPDDYRVYPEDDGTDRPRNPFSRV